MESLLSVLGQYWPLLAFLAFFGAIVLRRGVRGKAAEGSVGSQAQAGAAQGGMSQGTHAFSGSTRGVDWQAKVTLWRAEVDDGQANRRRNSEHSTLWSAPGARPGAGALLLMSLPEGSRPPPMQGRDGLLGAAVAQAAWAACRLYMQSSFGAERTGHLRLGPEHRIDLPPDAFGSAFVAFADPADLIDRLPPAAREALLQGHRGRPALLWDDEGLTLAWPHLCARPDQPAEVAALADYGATVAGQLAATPLGENTPRSPRS